LFISNGQSYPIFAQNAFTTARDSTGKIVCANCHLSASTLHIEVPQSVSSSTVMTLRLTIPAALSSKQLTSSASWLAHSNLGCVLLVPDGFTLAPGTRLRGSEKLLTEGIYLQPFNYNCNNTIVVGPIDCSALRSACSLDFPILSRSKGRCSTSYCPGTCYSVFGGANVGRGQFYPTGDSSNTLRATRSASLNLRLMGTRTGLGKLFSRALGATKRAALTACRLKTAASASDTIFSRSYPAARTSGGFGQQESTLVVQRGARLKSILNISLGIGLSQNSAVCKKRQFEAMA
jgi:apocytochrome f